MDISRSQCKISNRKSIVIFQSWGGTDKGQDGHRKDTIPISDSLKKLGWNVEVVKFSNQKANETFQYVVDRFLGYIGRINPGSLQDNEKVYFLFLKKLSDAGLIGMTHPDSMINFGAKSALVKLNKTGLVPEETFAYYDMESFIQNLPKSLKNGTRVLKQNRGSTGQGIWKVEIIDQRKLNNEDKLPDDTKIKCTQAVDNHVQYRQLGQFMKFCQKYLIGNNGMLVDMKFLPRIKQGQIRILMVGQKPIFIVHKKPAPSEDAFSATLFSGAKYTYDLPNKWNVLVDYFLDSLPKIKQSLKQKRVPLLWTADFILETDQRGNDKYILSEFNCSCVGFTGQIGMGIEEKVAQQAIRQIRNQTNTNQNY